MHGTQNDEPIIRLESESSNKKWPVRISDIATVWSNWIVEPPAKHEEYKAVINNLIAQVKSLNARISVLEQIARGNQSPRGTVPQRLDKLEGTVGGIVKKFGMLSPRSI